MGYGYSWFRTTFKSMVSSWLVLGLQSGHRVLEGLPKVVCDWFTLVLQSAQSGPYLGLKVSMKAGVLVFFGLKAGILYVLGGSGASVYYGGTVFWGLGAEAQNKNNQDLQSEENLV